ncbi:DUF2971 domain-containing protein [Acinetobacter oleivorans]|uniref:DUF2971 domain-containing protein n=1 Tax=Acinetobacter oleivorans TaxID=1148157 RepID=A0ABR9NLG3_9GAMM|nr:DUF2971 domain-containing protein [Acinetobacter oleivorans]MBE2165781.1 DUF2971 domain-containing protein [Acinetobacter oleivorans]
MSFYKYTSISTANIVLKNKSLRWSSPVLFNDLEECQYTPFTKDQYLSAFEKYIEILTQCAKGQSHYDTTKFSDVTQLTIRVMQLSMQSGTFDVKGIAESMLSMSTNFDSDYRDYINKALIRCFRILCVTGRYDNNLMWAHYADQHNGCVIELEQLYVEEPRLLRQNHVRYHENLEPLSNPIDMLLYGETKEIRDLMIKDVIFSKRTNWSYEEEYRLLFSESFGEITTTLDTQTKEKKLDIKYQSESLFTDVNIPKESIKSIIFGARTSSEDIENIEKTLSENDYVIDLYQMKMIDGKLLKEKLIFSDSEI